MNNCETMMLSFRQIKQVILFGTLACSILAPQCSSAATITSATITGPGTICDGESAEYDFTFSGSGAGNVVGTNFYVTIFDDEAIDDIMWNEVKFLLTDDALGNFTATFHFKLECKDGIIYGNGVSTGEGSASDPAEITGMVEGFFGGDYISASLDVHCVPCDAPEPSTFALLGLGGFGLAVSAYRRRRLTV